MVRFIGKNITFTQDDPPATYEELADALSALNVRDGLRTLGDAFAKLDETPNKSLYIQGTLVPSFALPPLALELILCSDDTKVGRIDDTVLTGLARCFHRLPWPDMLGDSPIELLIRMGQAQLSFQRNDPNRLARTTKVFLELWRTVPAAQALDLSSGTLTSFGLGLEETLLFGFAFSMRCRRGYVTRYGDLADSGRLGSLFTAEAQETFLRALAQTYDGIREQARLRQPAADDLRKFRFNPLVTYPLVIPDEQPPEVSHPVYLAPCPKFFLDRISDGLVLDGRRKFGSSFNEAFGHVVQGYVGTLLRDRYGDASVRADFEYRIAKRKYRSPDWTLFGNGRAIVLEVKKSLLFPQARAFGRLSDVKADLARTLGKALQQLRSFAHHVRHLREYPSRLDIELVVVTWDETWWSNSILLDQVANAAPDAFVHVISVHELERLLGICDHPDDFYELLWSKRCAGGDDAQMDMGDWLSRLPGGSDFRPLASLDRVEDDLFERWGMKRSVFDTA